ncbi:hypothetical protein G6F50_016113 [Rhizopus delemar]|uniref:Uncharacterized protein n=1 Tax=Rhizopus delemar TaxID=936053 RepID=A0A9P6XUZ4_9FUNG|nr:hypothetical protein G6F50_016113 [Rhizopus delemar]
MCHRARGVRGHRDPGLGRPRAAGGDVAGEIRHGDEFGTAHQPGARGDRSAWRRAAGLAPGAGRGTAAGRPYRAGQGGAVRLSR